MVSSKNNQTQQSAPMNITTLKNELKAIFDHQSLLQLARNTGFTRRLRNLSPLHFICAIVQTLGTQPKANLADIHRCLGAISGTMPNYKPFHNQMKKKALATLLQKLVERATKEWLLAPFKAALPKKYPFKYIHLHDGSSLKIHPALTEKFPGRFTKTTPAAIELHMTMD